MIDHQAAKTAIQRLRNFTASDPSDKDNHPTLANIARELNEACKLTGDPEVDVDGSLAELVARGEAESVGGLWRVLEVKAKSQGMLFG